METLIPNLANSLMTPLKECIGVSTGSVDADTVSRLREKSFDFAPVLDVNGLVSVQHLKDLHERKSPLLLNDPHIRKDVLDEGAELEKLLMTMANEGPVLVTRTQTVIGLLTMSDLNKPALRFVLYSQFATLEMELANLITRVYQDDIHWIDKLKEESQVRVLGHYEQSKRKNVVVAHIVACTLTDLLNVAVATEKIRDFFGFKNRKEAEEKCFSLIAWRNSVMHPVKPMVTKPEDVGSMLRSVQKVRWLGAALDEELMPAER